VQGKKVAFAEIQSYRSNRTGRTLIRDHRRSIVAMRRLPIRGAASRLPLAKNRQVTQLVGQRLVIRAMSHQVLHAHRIDNNRYNRQQANINVREDMS
jgi:hypothetical protein